jgi:hypothetical protein
MTELKARVSGLKTFCTARYLRKSASRGFGWLSILKDVYSKQCRLLARNGPARTHQRCPLLGGFCCKTRLRVAGGLACEFLVVGLRCFPIEGVGASTSPTPDGTLTPDKQRVLAEHGRGAWQAASGSARSR